MVFEDGHLHSAPGSAWLVTWERKGLGEHGEGAKVQGPDATFLVCLEGS